MMLLDDQPDSVLLNWLEGVSVAATQRYPGEPKTVAYGPRPEQLVDLWGNLNARLVVVSIHGGYFAPEYDRTGIEPLVRRLAHQGALVANVEYRRTDSAADPVDTVEDVSDAISMVVERIAGSPSIVVLGHSAGGYLSLACSTVPGIAAVLACAPVTDLGWCADGGWDDGAIAQWIGFPHTQDSAAWERMELRAVGVSDVACTVIHGVEDRVVPFAQSERFVRTRGEGAHAVRLVGLVGVGHYEFLDPESIATAAIVTALKECLRQVGETGENR